MNNGLSEHDVFILKTLFFIKDPEKLPPDKLIQKMLEQLLKMSNTVDFYETINNETAKKYDVLYYEYNAAKSRNFELFCQNEKLKNELFHIRKNENLRIHIIQIEHNKIVNELKAKLYDQDIVPLKIG